MALPVAILAGGLGTRMRAHAEDVPKALFEVAGEPFAAHQLRLLARNGYRDVVFLVGHLGEMIEAFVGTGERFGVSARYVYDGAALRGTAGAVVRALPALGNAFMLTFGDAYLRIDYADVERTFARAGTDGLMTLFDARGHAEAPNVVSDGAMVLHYDKKARTPNMEYIDHGLSVFRAAAFLGVDAARPVDLGEVNAALIARGELAAYVAPERPFEIGSPDGLAAMERYLQEGSSTNG